MTARRAKEAEAARHHESALRKAFADTFSEKLTKCPPLWTQQSEQQQRKAGQHRIGRQESACARSARYRRRKAAAVTQDVRLRSWTRKAPGFAARA